MEVVGQLSYVVVSAVQDLEHGAGSEPSGKLPQSVNCHVQMLQFLWEKLVLNTVFERSQNTVQIRQIEFAKTK